MPEPATTRDRLVSTAAQLFWEQGYAATGIKEILARSGVTSGSLYHFFPGKEALLTAVLDHYRAALDETILAPTREAALDPIERIFAVLDGYRWHLEAHDCALGCPIGNLAAELSDTHPEVRDRVAELFGAWAAGIERCLEAAADRLPEAHDGPSLARFVLTVMEGGVMQARARRSIAPFDDSVAHLRRYFELLQTPQRRTP